MQAVYPQQCAFLIDEQFSAPFQTTLQTYVSQKYQSCKDVKQLLNDISGKFNEIQSMDAYVCKTDHLCFSFDACQPLFLLNEQVVCNNFQLANKEHYHGDIVNNLFRITTDNLSCTDVSGYKKVADFITHVPAEIFQEFDVRWYSDNEIILSQKESSGSESSGSESSGKKSSGKDKRSDILIFSDSKIPTLQDIVLFKKIQATSKSRKKQMYDFRFKDQIIVK